MSGAVDKVIKEESAKYEEGPSSSAFSSSSSVPRPSPLSRILRLRLVAARPLLIDLDDWHLINDDDEDFATATDDDLHALTARASLLCLRSLKRHLNAADMESIGSKDRKSIATLLSLASQWGFGPALLSYNAAFAELVTQPQSKLEEVEVASDRKIQAQERFSTVHASLCRVFELTYSLFESVEQGPTISSFESQHILNAHQPIAGQLLGSAIRLAMGPDGRRPSAATQIPPPPSITKARALLGLLFKDLQPSMLLPLLSSVSSSQSSSQDTPPTPPFVRKFATRVLSAQLLRPGGMSSLISTVMSLDAESTPPQSDMDTSPTRKLDRLVTLLITPPQGMPQDVFLAEHTVPTLLALLTGTDGTNQSTQAREAFASVAAYTFHRILLTHQALLEAKLRPLTWDRLSSPTPSSSESPIILASSDDLASSIDALHLLTSHAPAVASEWIRWLVTPVAHRLWQLLEVLNAGGTPKGISPIRKERDRNVRRFQTQTRDVVQAWIKHVDANDAADYICKLRTATPEDSEPTVHFLLQDDGCPKLVFDRRAPSEKQGQMTADQLMKHLSAGISHTDLNTSGDDNDNESLKKSLQMLAGLSDGGGAAAAQPSPLLVCDVLRQAKRSDVAALLLPRILEDYIAVKSDTRPDTSATHQLLSSLHLVTSLVDAFGEHIVVQEAQQALRFVNICLGGSSGDEVTPEPRADQPPNDADIPFISANGKSAPSTAMQDLLNANSNAPSAPAKHSDDEADEVDEDIARLAVDLLLSILERNADMTPQSTPLLYLIERKLTQPRFSAHSDEELRRVVKEAGIVLLARRQCEESNVTKDDDMPTLRTTTSATTKIITDKYEEALKLLQDPILPVRAHGLVLLREIAASASPSSPDVASRRAAAALLPSIFDLLMRAVEDEESYLYMNAIQALKEVILCGQPYLSQVTLAYADSPAALPFARQEVDKRLRLGEALLNAVQALGAGGAAHAGAILPPLLSGLRQSQFPTTLRSSILSLLGTCVEAFPAVFATSSLSTDLTDACLHILALESVSRPSGSSSHAAVRDHARGEENKEENKKGNDKEDDDADDADDLSPEELKRRLKYAPGADDAVGFEPAFPQLRRGALLLLNLLIGGATAQLDAELDDRQEQDVFQSDQGLLQGLRLPGGGTLPRLSAPSPPRSNRLSVDALLFPPASTSAVRTTLAYIQSNDTDALVRHQASETISALDTFELAMVRLGLSA